MPKIPQKVILEVKESELIKEASSFFDKVPFNNDQIVHPSFDITHELPGEEETVIHEDPLTPNQINSLLKLIKDNLDNNKQQ